MTIKILIMFCIIFGCGVFLLIKSTMMRKEDGEYGEASIVLLVFGILFAGFALWGGLSCL